MEFHDLEVFRMVAREKSFSRAARALFRTQPAVSLAVRRLEDELGEPLFDRSNKAPQLTEQGQLVLNYAERLLNLRGEIVPALIDLRDLNKGQVRIGANETGGIFLLPFVAEFHKAFPNIKVEIVRSFSSETPSEIAKRSLDLGILSYLPQDSNLSTRVVYTDRLIFAVSPTHALAEKKRVSIKKLGAEVFAAHGILSPYREKIQRTFERFQTPLNIMVELPTVESLKRFVLMGRAVSFIPRMCIESELQRGELVEVEVLEVKVERKMRVAYRRGEKLSQAAQHFLDIISKNRPDEDVSL